MTGLPVGATAADVETALVTPDGTVTDRCLSDLVAENPVLLCFYTADFSPDCTDEWCAFRDFDWFAAGRDVTVVGASKSGVGMHRRFIDRYDLTFPLYADTDLELASEFDVVYRTFGVSKRAHRSCFLLDEDLTVRYRWLGEHWLDPTRDVPPLTEVHEGITDALELESTENFGF
ncbi:redoxin domain-containing protein [Haloferax sp. MBLA0076]|uniref:thioredoxin-dependent peroxiredoxin n=1 Tax=Haloferax litoreum TaxID=2666140 RepID=A0A6A8GC59_9EURY|nr:MULTISPECIES: redoxin domain-containing protein [Haloferax]KAB1192369.1 redoxin domain-containing protein [Haloferax sp. CBA1148]MRX20834.1 redoxin domain-containing protein [Haloferax litoreum]